MIRYQLIQELQGYGPMDMVLLQDLEPGTEYIGKVRFNCALNNLIETEFVAVSFKALAPGKYM